MSLTYLRIGSEPGFNFQSPAAWNGLE